MKIRHLAPLGLFVVAAAAVAAQPAGDKPQAEQAKTGPEYETRDWAKIDLDKDGLISPEEMAKYLAENPGPLRPVAERKP